MKKVLRLITSFVFLVGFSTPAFCEQNTPLLSKVKEEWVTAKYELEGKEQHHAFDVLLDHIQLAREKAAAPPALLDCWEGTTLSSYASTVGGTKALSMTKKARTLLERSIDADETLEGGLALGVLGTLYHKVPSWPLGFKDEKKARHYLQRAMAVSPSGVHSNFYYAEYLADMGDITSAREYLNTALRASKVSKDSAAQARAHEIALKVNSLPAKG